MHAHTHKHARTHANTRTNKHLFAHLLAFPPSLAFSFNQSIDQPIHIHLAHVNQPITLSPLIISLFLQQKAQEHREHYRDRTQTVQPVKIFILPQLFHDTKPKVYPP